MSSHEEHAERPGLSETATGREGETAITDPGIPAVGDGPIPRWLVALIFVGLFWSGAYLFSYSGGFFSPVFFSFSNFWPPRSAAPAPPPPTGIGKRPFSPPSLSCPPSK